ncbi:hypothetical protein GM661_02690 [Iocasia frigidifontis]|uniref:Magnesium transporter MgtE intracellular domain-containing protein n=1 Tax=Iocasia fonsfrigidae TaxID=2682810 RepID=A0A8A7K712_9FIRM|nr:hypothetical protein [Iocasia fonsfrigidae]QTL96960.1 hypothetical protein GM661_02690 [Iocasia fonsfrigidae]
MKKALIIFLILIILGSAVYLLETFNLISLRAWGERVIVNTPFLKEYVQTNEAFLSIADKTKRLEGENKLLLQQNQEMEGKLEELTKFVDQQQAEIESLTEELAKARDRSISEEERLNKLVKIYSEMEAEEAARIIATLEKELAIKILRNLKEKDASAILTQLSPADAADFSLALDQ